ncbi:MAG: hypothetical protein CVU91_10920 [Firmicutes bacterium HGW-Firmicutes-16]|nr:MAG: hypothetical protein CVU91_10920 [Firmicutes bacterium HGW-Firmicutes-16]
MPAKKKPKPIQLLWVIKCDGFCVEIVRTEPEAKKKKNEYEKLYPTHMKFTLEPLKGNPAHCTTA